MIDLTQLAVASPVSYLVAFLVPALDAIVPVLPSETAVIALGVATAGSTDPRIAVLVVLAAGGAFVGDNLAYLIGRRFGPAAQRRFFASQRGAHRGGAEGRAVPPPRWGGGREAPGLPGQGSAGGRVTTTGVPCSGPLVAVPPPPGARRSTATRARPMPLRATPAACRPRQN